MDNKDDGNLTNERGSCGFCSSWFLKPPAMETCDSIETISQTLSEVTLADGIGPAGTVSASSSEASNKVQGQLIGVKRRFRFDYSPSQLPDFVSDLSNTSSREDHVVESRNKRPRFQRCQEILRGLSPSSGEESTSSCDETYPYSQAERSKRRESDEAEGRRAQLQHGREVRKGRCGWNLDLKDLPQDLVEALLMRLPLVSLYRSRFVSRQWNSIISSITSNPQGRELWAKNKPVERWILLYNRMQEVLFYDVQKNVCYKWQKSFWPRITSSHQHLFPRVTCFHGTVFLSVCRPDVQSHTRIWECNPLTHGYDKLPLMPHTAVSVLDMVAVRKVDTVPAGSFKLLVFSSDYQLPGVTRFQVYDPVAKEWEEVPSLTISDLWIPEVVKSFGTNNGKVAVFDKFRTNLSDSILRFYCYRLNGNVWTTHEIQGLQTEGRMLQQWEMFERDWSLIVLLVDRDRTQPWRSPRAQLWRKPLPSPENLQPPGESPWQLLSTMPSSLKVLEVSDDGIPSTGTAHSTACYLLCDRELKVVAVADEINGDRLVIISTRAKYVVTFNFSMAPSDAWVAIDFSTLERRSRQIAGTSSGKSVPGPGAAPSYRSEKVRGKKICRLLTDKSVMGVTFEPDVRWR